MEIILLSNTPGSNGPIRIGRFAIAFFGALLLGLAGLTAYFSFKAGQFDVEMRPDFSKALVQEQIRRQQVQVELAIGDAQSNVNALALRLGEMQADLIRLDALGERLVDMAHLDATEFDFRVRPAMGGPHNPGSIEAQAIPDFVISLEQLAQQLEDRAPKLAVLEELLMSEQLQKQIHPGGRPVETGWMSSGYGYRTDPLSGKRAFHSGVDFAGPAGSPVLAVASGVVTNSRYRQGMGNLVEINHGGGYVTRYAHNEKNLVKVGDTVKKGQKVAVMGNSGRSTGPHVHFEVLHDGKSVNPLKYVRSKS